MLDRVFAATDVMCRCTLRLPEGEPAQAELSRISRTRAVFDHSGALDEESEVEVEFSFDDETALTLMGRVVHSGEKGLYLEWQHEDDTAAGRLQTLLVESAFRQRARRAVDAPEDSPAAPRVATVKPTDERATPPSDAAPAEPATASPETAAPPARSAAEPGQDVSARLLRHAKTMKSSDLAAARKSVQVLDMATLAGLIQEAVDEAMQHIQQLMTDDERQRLLEEAEEKFKERLENFKAEKKGLQSKANHLQAQLETAQKLVEDERGRVVSADQFTVSDAGIVELEARVTRIVEGAVKKGRVTSEFESELREVVARLLDDEREKISEKEREAQSDALELLERKMTRLAKALDETTKARKKAERRAQLLESSGGGMRPTMEAGLDDDDPEKERKVALLKELIDTNHKVRAEMRSQGLEVLRPARNTKPDESPEPETQDSPPGVTVEMTDSGVKKISVASTAPPPLQRTGKRAESAEDTKPEVAAQRDEAPQESAPAQKPVEEVT